MVKKHETKLEPIDQELLELGPFAKERHEMVHHDWPLPLDLHVTPRKRKPYSPTGRGGRRVKSTDELSPLAGVLQSIGENLSKNRGKREFRKKLDHHHGRLS